MIVGGIFKIIVLLFGHFRVVSCACLIVITTEWVINGSDVFWIIFFLEFARIICLELNLNCGLFINDVQILNLGWKGRVEF